jgi:hypothetical protein
MKEKEKVMFSIKLWLANNIISFRIIMYALKLKIAFFQKHKKKEKERKDK